MIEAHALMAIMTHFGKAAPAAEQIEDIEAEYELIKQKKSKLSAVKRKRIVAIFESKKGAKNE